MNAFTVTTRCDRLPGRSAAGFLRDPFEVDPSDEMSGDLISELKIDFRVSISAALIGAP
jgi:hypothetical protein